MADIEKEREASVAKAVGVMKAYAAFLFLCGVAGFAMAGFQAKGRTSIIMGTASAAVVFLSSMLSAKTGIARKIGIHFGLILPLVFTGVFVWRATKAFPVPAKQYLAYLLCVMAVGSVIAEVALLKFKPKAPPKKSN